MSGAPGGPPGDTVPDAVAIERPAEGYRARTARGVLINSAFRIGLAGFTLVRNVAIAGFLTTAEYGLWALVLTTLITLGFLKQIGITDKYVQQRERDQELAFQRAFTLELAYSGLFYLLVAVAVPLYALVIYDRPDVLAPAAVLSVALLISAFQAPIWIFYRRMEYVKQRSLEAIDPVISTIVMIALLAAGMDIWGLVIGALAGTCATALTAVVVSPYRLRLRFSRQTLREYVGFSWPLLYSGLGGLVVVQGALIGGNLAVGLAGVGLIGLAGNFARFATRVELLLRNTMYPAIAAVRDRREVMLEAFVKANRIGLMWALPFGFALTLFAGQFVDVALGERWIEAVPLLRVFGLIFGFGTVGYAWITIYQAVGNTRPAVVATTVTVAVFAAVTLPLMFEVGVMGYAYGMSAAVVAQLFVRAFYLRRLFPGFNLARHTLRALAPVVPAVAVVLALRLVGGGEATGALGMIAELSLYLLVAVVATVRLERPLLGELLGYLRRATGRDERGAEGATAA